MHREGKCGAFGHVCREDYLTGCTQGRLGAGGVSLSAGAGQMESRKPCFGGGVFHQLRMKQSRDCIGDVNIHAFLMRCSSFLIMIDELRLNAFP